MKKGQVLPVKIEKNKYPFQGIATLEDKKVKVKNAIAGQTISLKVTRKRKNDAKGKNLGILENAPAETEQGCIHFPDCGGCLLQKVPYDQQVAMVEDQIMDLFAEAGLQGFHYDGLIKSPLTYGYRNKMEYTFGNPNKDEPLELGMHRRGRFTDVLGTYECNIAPKDFNIIQKATRDYFAEKEIPFYNKFGHEGYLRHLLVRQGVKTKEILVALATSSQLDLDLSPYVDLLKGLELEGTIVGIVHIVNDQLADAFKVDEKHILYGRDYYLDELMGLTFKVSLLSFFQTNPLGAELLYQRAFDYIDHMEDKVVYDLFSGTGTIGQVAAKKAKMVYGIELIEEAVAAAKENAKENNLDHCEFIAGDVFKMLPTIPEQPDIIIVDPPRMGMTEKTVEKIASYKIPELVYVSCNPVTLVENLKQFKELGYELTNLSLVDMFPHTPHVESVVRLKLKY